MCVPPFPSLPPHPAALSPGGARRVPAPHARPGHGGLVPQRLDFAPFLGWARPAGAEPGEGEGKRGGKTPPHPHGGYGEGWGGDVAAWTPACPQGLLQGSQGQHWGRGGPVTPPPAHHLAPSAGAYITGRGAFLQRGNRCRGVGDREGQSLVRVCVPSVTPIGADHGAFVPCAVSRGVHPCLEGAGAAVSPRPGGQRAGVTVTPCPRPPSPRQAGEAEPHCRDPTGPMEAELPGHSPCDFYLLPAPKIAPRWHLGELGCPDGNSKWAPLG